MQSTTNGTWTWWHQDHGIVVGWLRPEQFGNDLPLIQVTSARDAQLLVGVLGTLEARPALGTSRPRLHLDEVAA